jgi:MYXO-CTERM domain-containing protein
MTKIPGAQKAWRLIVPALFLFQLLLTAQAYAYGRVEWKSKDLKESDGHSWTIDLSVYLTKAPDVSTLPMRFSFTPVVYYERTLIDGKDGPQLRKVPLDSKPPLVESVDVGFMDPGNGQIQKRTKFSFKVTRAHGYEAGEYDVEIKDGRSDAAVGQKVRLVFEGENEVIDRRAIVFSGEKKKKDEDKTEEKKDEPEKKVLGPNDPGFWAGGPKDEKKEEVEPKRGCGCRVGTSPRSSDAGLAFLATAVVGTAFARRRTFARR